MNHPSTNPYDSPTTPPTEINHKKLTAKQLLLRAVLLFASSLFLFIAGAVIPMTVLWPSPEDPSPEYIADCKYYEYVTGVARTIATICFFLSILSVVQIPFVRENTMRRELSEALPLAGEHETL
jgi:formate hydrogenlyase subunit 3/multisubunit Na+/H+ antiporter MnhD subunit